MTSYLLSEKDDKLFAFRERGQVVCFQRKMTSYLLSEKDDKLFAFGER